MQAEQQNKQNMKKRIIISTSWYNLTFLRRRQEEKSLQLLENNLFIGYCYLSNEFVALKSDTDIILIKDTATKEELVNANINFNKDTDYFLHHTNENGLINEQGELFGSKIQKGAHDPRPDDLYQPVFEKILDNEPNKSQGIIDFLFPPIEDLLKAKLQLLHEIYEGENLELIGKQKKEESMETEESDWFRNLKQDDKDAFNRYKESVRVNYDNSNDTHRKSLTVLRDFLLADI